jgi:hypothetical protein
MCQLCVACGVLKPHSSTPSDASQPREAVSREVRARQPVAGPTAWVLGFLDLGRGNDDRGWQSCAGVARVL